MCTRNHSTAPWALKMLLLVCFVLSAMCEFSSTKDPMVQSLQGSHARRTSEELLALNRNKTILQEQLMASYKKFVPPAGGADCQIQLALYSIVEVSTSLQTIKIQGWWRHYWADERLSWDQDEWNVPALVFNIGEIWTPDDLVYELIEEDHLGNVAVTVYPGGSVFYSAPRVTTVGCRMQLSKYPYDIQTCQFTVGSMSFDGSLVDVLPRTVSAPDEYFEEASVYQDKTAIDLTQFRPNKEFALTKVRIVSQNFYYNCCPEPYPVIVFEITIQRQTLTFLSGILVPIIAVTFVGFSVMLMPAPLSGARPSISISVMFTTTAIYLVASRKLPEVGEYTMIGRLYMASLASSLIMTFISIFTSAINLVVSEQNNNRSDLLAVFRHYDSDRSGTLDYEEADRALSALGLTEKERDYVLAKHDMSEKDEISIDEWLRLGELSRDLRPTTQYSVAISKLVTWLNKRSNNQTQTDTKLNSVVPEDEEEEEPGKGDVEAANGAGGEQPLFARMPTRRTLIGKRNDLSVETVKEWLMEMGVDLEVVKKFEDEMVDVLALANLPLEKLEAFGIDKVGQQGRLIGLAKETVAKKKGFEVPGLLGDAHAVGFRCDPSAVSGGAASSFHPVGATAPPATNQPSKSKLQPIGSPMRTRSNKDGKKLAIKSKFKHLGAWVDCISLVVFPLIFFIFIVSEFSDGLDFKGSAVDVEKVNTVLELVDMRAEGEMCFANTQSIALPGSALCPDVEIVK